MARTPARERVLSALHHQRPDRTPRDFWAEPPALRRLLEHMGVSEEQMLERLGVDIRRIQAVEPEPRPIGGGVLQNMWGERFVYRATPWGPLREDLPGALAGARSFQEIRDFPWPSPDVLDHSGLQGLCRRYDGYAILYGFADVWQRPALVRGWAPFFEDMVERPEWAHALCRRFTDFYLEDYTRAQRASDGRIDLFLLISDLGGQRGPLISPAMFREFALPYIRAMIERIHELGGAVLFHSCGNVASFLPDLIAAGVDILDPIQPVAPEMEPERLRAEYGGRLCFHGGLDTQRLLPFGSPEEVRAEAARYCATLGADGGYILAPAHLFQPDVRPENILAMYDDPDEAA